MKPHFKDTLAWQQAELLMQPAFIRLIDNIRKQLDLSNWQGSYQDVQIWSEGVSEATKAQVQQLQAELETAEPEQAAEIERTLADLPTPFPGYLLCLKHQDQQVTVDLWELCYQICFRNYADLQSLVDTETVEIDTSLIDDEVGEVDWNRLDDKARTIVERVFAELPTAS